MRPGPPHTKADDARTDPPSPPVGGATDPGEPVDAAEPAEPPTRPEGGRRVPARGLLRSAERLRRLARTVVDGDAGLREDVAGAFGTVRARMVRRELGTIPVSRLQDATGGRLRLGRLEKSGYTTVLHVVDARPEWLDALPGVGRATATQAVAAARRIADAVDEGLRFHVDLNPDDPDSTALVVALHRLRGADDDLAAVHEPAAGLDRDLPDLLAAARPGRSWLRMLFVHGRRRDQVEAAVGRVAALVDRVNAQDLWGGLARAADAVRRPAPAAEVAWRDFERHSPEYYGLLGEVVDLRLDVNAAEGFLPADIIARVHEQQLDDRLRRVSLRGYQSFGARFALVQQRVILGDEMGLGKTIQAIAALAHLRARGHTHFLVVCPASVLINWTREITARSHLRAFPLHGADRAANLKRWVGAGDVAVTTFDSLRTLNIRRVSVAMLVVDEAHFVKNPAALRSKAVARWSGRVERVLFLTGTPMENRVEEFRNLVDYLQPRLADELEPSHRAAGPVMFRKSVAPVYLRRNQDDVLAELPALVRTDEWLEFGKEDLAAYRHAVAEGNFMAMRRAAYLTGRPEDSVKLARLLEIVADAAENGRKVVVFSYFRDVLDLVAAAVGPAALGPLTGGMTPAQRLGLVDRMDATDGHAVLVSQIQAGGVGMNMQAASVVILCEPQVKPTIEEQAIARAHRMGQVRSVQVHRLLVADSVDQRMLELLDRKTALFDQYARRSDMAAATPDAVDVSDVSDVSDAELARRIVADEQQRLADLGLVGNPRA